MKKLFKNLIVPAFISVQILFGNPQNASAQSSVQDSLQYLLSYFHDSAANENIRQAIAETQVLYQADKINDSLAKKLLLVEDLLLKNPQLKKQMVIKYAENLVYILENLEPKKENLYYAAGCNSLGRLYAQNSEYKKAELLLLEAKQIREKLLGKANVEYAATCSNLGYLYRLTAQYKEAEKFYLEAKDVREKVLTKNHPDYAQSCNSLGNLYNDMSQYNKAEFYYTEAKQIREKVLGKSHPDYAASCTNLGILYMNTGQYTKAEKIYLEAKQLLENTSGKEHPNYAATCLNLANLYNKTGQYQKAEPLYFEVKDIREKAAGNEHPDYAMVCHNLGILYWNMGQYEKAEALYLEAKEIYKKIPVKGKANYAQTCNNLASLYEDMRKYEMAESLYLESRQILEGVWGKEHAEYGASCNNLANLYVKMKLYEKAKPLYLEALQIREKVLGKQNSDFAQSCNGLGSLYAYTGEYEKAISLLLEAKEIREKTLGKAHPDYIETCINLANLYFKLKEAEKANELYSEAYQSQSIALKKIFQFTSEAEQQSYLKKIANFQNYFLSFTSVYPNSDANFMYDVSLSNRNTILSSSKQLRKVVYNLSDTISKNKYNNWINLREQLAFWYSKPVAEQPDYIKDLEEQSNTLEKELTRISSAFQQEQQQGDVTWKTIQQNLKLDEAAIEFAKFHFYNGSRWTDSTYYIALLLTKQAEPKLIPLFENNQFTNYKTVTAFYTRTKGINIAYNLIWKPIEKHLSGITKIYFAPAGLLYHISLQALPVNNTETLSDKYQLIQLNTTASIANQSENFINASDKIYLYGGIQYDVDSVTLKKEAVAYSRNDENKSFFPNDLTRGGGSSEWQYLPNTEKEINEIKNLGRQKNYSVTVSSGTAVTEESIKTLNGNVSPAVLHIATHGFFFPNPKEEKKESNFGTVFRQSDNPLFRSGLLFAGANYAWKGQPIKGVEDGILTAYEISNLYLPNTKLVVLSACETGLGEIEGNEGVYGLQRAFKIAGVENLIMSLWKVPDKETSEFMQAFYKNIFDRQSIDDAFYKAQTTMKNKYHNEPFKWAAWILVK